MMKQLAKKFAQEEKGAPIIEIVILIAMAAVIAAILFPNLRTAVGNWFNKMLVDIQTGLTGTAPAYTAPTDTGTITNGNW